MLKEVAEIVLILGRKSTFASLTLTLQQVGFKSLCIILTLILKAHSFLQNVFTCFLVYSFTYTVFSKLIAQLLSVRKIKFMFFHATLKLFNHFGNFS